jgi:hypothetical protein
MSPLTQRDIKKAKRARRTDFVIVENRSNQAIPIQTAVPNQDFFLGEAAVTLHRNKSAKLPADSVLMHQLENLQKRGMITFRLIIEEDKKA